MPLVQAEQEVFGCTHAEIAAYLLGIWGLPNQIVEAVAFHHRPGELPGESFAPVTAVYVANILARVGEEENLQYPGIDKTYLERIGLLGRLAKWEAVCAEQQQEEQS